jgi:hypothetical protein
LQLETFNPPANEKEIAEKQSQIDQLISKDPLFPLTPIHKRLIWDARYYCLQHKRVRLRSINITTANFILIFFFFFFFSRFFTVSGESAFEFGLQRPGGRSRNAFPASKMGKIDAIGCTGIA